MLDAKDKALIEQLSANSRQSTAELARKLKLSRSTVTDRIERLEKRGIINGYTIRFSEAYTERQIKAHVLISSDPKQAAQIVSQLKQLSNITSLYAVNGVYDMIAIVSADSPHFLDQTLDEIGAVAGIEKTVSSIILSTKLDR